MLRRLRYPLVGLLLVLLLGVTGLFSSADSNRRFSLWDNSAQALGSPTTGGEALDDGHMPPTRAIGTAVIYRVSRLNVRAYPSLDAPVAGQVGLGETVDILGYRHGSWIFIHTPDNDFGWVNKYYLNTRIDLMSLPQMSMDEAMYGHRPPAPQPPGPQPPEPRPLPPDQAVIIRQGGLNVRRGPGFDWPVVTQVALGEHVGLTGVRDATTTWIQIRLHDGTVGWVNKGYLQTSADFSKFDVWDGDPGYNRREATITGASSVNVRVGPDWRFDKITYVRYGEEVLLYGYRNPSGTWVVIRTQDGTVGWINARYLETDFNIYNLEIGMP